MKTILTIFFLSAIISSQTNPKFEDYFFDETLRIDYFHIGDAKTEIITIDKLHRYGIWAGSLNHLIDNFNNGKYYLKIYDYNSGNLIYSKGFDTFFGEYASGDNGVNGIQKSFQETAVIPLPKNRFAFVLEKRDEQNELKEFFRTLIDPNSIYFIKDKIADETVEVFKPVNNGDPHKKVDIVILAEGYTTSEKEKFENDLNRFVGYFFLNRNLINHREIILTFMVCLNLRRKAELIYRVQIFLLIQFLIQLSGRLVLKDT